MTSVASTDKLSPQGSLQRGKACLRCRKRKMRCDGVKPSCQQCARAKKADACEYDDGKGKTRTQLLREKIDMLEKRIKELEDPDNLVPAMALYDPGQGSRHMSESSSSGYGSPPPPEMSLSPFGGMPADPASLCPSPYTQAESSQSPEHSWTNLPGLIRTSSPFTDVLYDDPAQTALQPTIDLARMLLDIFAPHQRQCGLETNIAALADSLTRPASEQRHPVLMNAIYLWACFVSRPEPLCQHEDYYLTQALSSLQDALRQGDHVLDIIQGSCLLTSYFFANGRMREGSYHLGAAVNLAMQYQLHQGLLFDRSSNDGPSTSRAASFPDPTSWERISTFWQVYNLDRCWSVVLQKPALIPDGPDAWSSINCPWPQEQSHYESAALEMEVSFQTIRAFFNGDVTPAGFSPLAIRAKASSVLQRAHHISLSWDPRTTSTDLMRDEIRVMDVTILAFLSSLLPLHQLDSALPETRRLVLTAYTLAHTATIHLYRRFAKDDPVSYDKCLQSASNIVGVCRLASGHDHGYLDPVIGHCWSTASDILLLELDRIVGSWGNPAELRGDIGTLLYALNSLSSKFPFLALAASKIQTRLAEL
ncbi:hypothetical protein DL96DRAFT_1557809 [Flagelloscypha sp. PMI_526]|nr:hypothetical protein DL96DRAFT_1557809 [Flagelloscypha sp. PMI_526]